MWRRTVLVLNLLAVINRTSTQSASNGTEEQAPQQCCPCPPVAEPGSVLGAASAGAPAAAGQPRVASPVDPDDCPCRPRDADPEGVSSLSLSNSLHCIGNVVRSEPADEVKPLLQPEVDLASSVLETLREATDEEYRDALERDAGRSAAFDAENNDVTPEEARNVVTIIVSPKDMTDDVISEASHVQATRCIDSLLGNPRASFNRPPVNQKGLEDILNLPLPGGLLHRQRDSNLAASNVHESVVKADNNLNKVLSGLRLRSDPGLLNLDPHKISEDISKILSGQKLGLNNDSRRKTTQPTVTVTDSMTNMIDNKNFDDDESSVETQINEDAIDIDLPNIDTDPSTSNVHGLFAEANEKEARGLQKEDSFPNLKYPLLTKNVKADTENLFPLRNLLKLKDVELIPLDLNRQIPKSKVNVPSMKIEPLQTNKARKNAFNQIKLPKLSDLFAKPSKTIIEKGTSKEATDEVVKSGNIEKSANIQTIPRKTLFKTEILDTIPSTSEVKQVTFNKDNCLSLKPNVVNLSDIETSNNVDAIENLNTDPDAEQVIESIPKDEDNLNISDIGTSQGFDSKSSKSTGNNKLDGTEFIDVIDEDLESDNNELVIIPDDYIDDIDPASVDLSELEKVENQSNHPFKNLKSFRKSVVEKLNALEISDRQALENIKHSVGEIAENSDSDEARMKASETTELSSPSNHMKNELKEEERSSTEDVTFQDLQNMSDSILSASENREKVISPKIIKVEKYSNRDSQNLETDDGNFEPEKISKDENDDVLGMDGTKQIQNEGLKFETEINSSGINNSENKESFVDEEEINLCPSDLIEKPSSDETESKSSDENKKNENDLTTLASEPVVHSIFRPNSKSLIEHLSDIESTLRGNLIVQPAPLINTDNLNIFRAPMLSIPDISELNTNIPTLEEIRMRVSEILGGLARKSGDEEVSSEFDSEDFASNSNSVVSASGSSFAPISILPTLKPLENINLDIVQLKPLPLLPGLNPLKSQFPGLNLNTYKAKLSVPKSLDLKPLQLASTLGNDGGLVGAMLSVGPEKKNKTGKSKLKPKAKSNYDSSARNSPSLADITTSIQNNARNLLNIPETSRGQILQASNVVENFAENIKSHTENTMRNIHQTLYPSRLDAIHADLRKNANNLLNSGRNTLGSLHTVSPINNAVGNLRAQTEATLNHVHQTLNYPKLADLSSTIHRNPGNVLKSHLHATNKILKNKPSGSIDAALDSLKAQSANTYRNVQRTSPLEDLSKSIHKTAKHILNSSSGITSGNNVLRATQQRIPQITKVVDNLRSQSDSTLMNIQKTLNTPAFSDISSSIQKSAQQILKAPIRNTHIEVLKNSLPLDNVVDNLKSHTQNTMKHIQKTLSTPTLVPTHTQNLLKSPIATAGRDTFEQILQASPPVIDLTPHAEKAVKDLQRTLKATLRNSPIKDLQPLTNPTHVLQMISDHHEDVNDKLFAIRTDLADRLESMHNDVMDSERLRALLSPPSQQFELFTIPLPKSRMSTPNLEKQVSPPLKSKQPYFDSQKKESRRPTVPKASKLKAGVTKLGAMRASSGKDRGLPKSLKLPTAASAPVPAKIKKPIFPLFPKKAIFPKPLNSDLFIDPLPPGPEPRKTYQSTTTRRPFIPKPKTGPKVSTPRPNLSPVSKRPPFVPSPTTPRPKISNDRFKPKPLVRQQTPWTPTKSAKPISTRDPLPSASRAVPLTQLAKSNSAIPAGSNTKIGTLPRLLPLLSRHNPQQLVKPKPNYEISPPAQGRSSNGDIKSLSSPIKPQTLLLSKLTNALKGKQTKVNFGSPLGMKSRTSEMAPAASENIGDVVAIENPMKENVAYK
ncbi:hypothetical protein MSG28_005880 [Choristoneura fumiferana]|uniref:Uncharacterized protein n=2 Tax=Choristoneura fumiferana TaxID=7141 RepID=A0ACC0L152_CHOFU|nr:hypothetical protein MSG28_005880 [Choristoneura fumiferana]